MSKRKGEYLVEILDEDYHKYLEHHGVDGQKWGVKHGPPYPLENRSERRARRKAERAAKKKQKQRAAQLAKARKTKKKNQILKKKQAEKEEKEKKEREKILRDPKKLYRNRHKFQKDEIENALKRFEWEEKIHNYSTNRLANTAKNADNIIKTLDAGLRGYNKVASAYNAFVSENSQLPIIEIGKKRRRDDSGNS